MLMKVTRMEIQEGTSLASPHLSEFDWYILENSGVTLSHDALQVASASHQVALQWAIALSHDAMQGAITLSHDAFARDKCTIP